MDPVTTIRVDRWLWASRFFKTRPDAVSAINAGHILINDQRCRPSKLLQCGDRLLIRRGLFVSKVTVLSLINKRVSATIASHTFTEDPKSIEARKDLSSRLRAESPPHRSQKGRPAKKERRALDRLRYAERSD